MQKIPTLFHRNHETDHLVRDEITVGTEWVAAGEGVATRKWDGTACLVREGRLFRRFDAKRGKTPPPGFEPADDPDPVTGHWPGWVPVGDGPEDKWVRSAPLPPEDGTYELCGPKVQGNPERLETHLLIPHGERVLPDAPQTFEGLRSYLQAHEIEGIVFWHEDGRMAKIKRRDFGFKWPLPRGS